MSSSIKKRPTLITVAIVLLVIVLVCFVINLITTLGSLFVVNESTINDLFSKLPEGAEEAMDLEGIKSLIVTFWTAFVIVTALIEAAYIALTAAVIAKAGKATSKKQIKGWAIAYLILTIFTCSLLGIVASILILCTKPSAFDEINAAPASN